MRSPKEALDLGLEHLLSRVADGDRLAFSQLHAETAARLMGIALLILGDRGAAEDSVQEAFVKIWLNAKSFRAERGAALGWLISLQRNQAIDALRRRRHLCGIDEAAQFVDGGIGPEAATVVVYELRQVERCLAKLPLRHASVVRLAYYEGWSYDELARRDGVPVNTIRTWLRRSLIRLRHCLACDPGTDLAGAPTDCKPTTERSQPRPYPEQQKCERKPGTKRDLAVAINRASEQGECDGQDGCDEQHRRKGRPAEPRPRGAK